MAWIPDMSLEDFQYTIRFEIELVFLATKAAWPHLVARGGGVIINVASMAGMFGSPVTPMSAHCAGKAAVIGFTRQVAAEGAPHGIRAVCISPGPIATPVTMAHMAATPEIEVFARHGGAFVPTWNWRAFVFGPLWYFRRGLYAKGVVLLGLSVFPFFTLAVTVLLGLTVLVYCGVAGNWDDYLWKVKGTQWW
jgi:NAD(P)-dependent dehydrogenase (short-subunit alcohol dehydrogenase family)